MLSWQLKSNEYLELKEPLMNYANYTPDLDRSTMYVKELFLREVSLAGVNRQKALEQMLRYGYVDRDLRFLCNSQYIKHSEYMAAFQSFVGAEPE